MRIFTRTNTWIMTDSILIQKAEFSPKIKTYIILYVGLILLLTIIGIPLLIVWFLGLGSYVSNRYYQNLKCRLTDRHLVFSKGAFFKVEKTIPLENIQDLTFIENPILNTLDLRILKIETAGGSNPNGSDMKLIGISEAESFKQKVLEQRELVRMKTERHGQGVDVDGELLQLVREIRDLVQAVVTEGGRQTEN